jgi:hypothetical protein
METLKDTFIITIFLHSQLVKLNEFVELEEEKYDTGD